ncbi:NAD-dependent epimerase/dehydratase family protein [Aliiroseovarius sp. PrR006]|uniref:NAD-dependent epimerase/dehydratase family protein n=1 Tax=Aliiroseovarius sp. PrR006 TaxID=2706883 RepID=UPI0013D440A8|nr:NAD-dependent epimerase/dehydratase family protein [Aliiroseovarius sp. PrR006]NDW52459.1 NAD-dependent epimerase/dehydratase family protein [Aliiroseovarius sp. PrR006]
MSTGAQDGFWQGKTVLVTGASGFLGSWTIKALRDKGAETVGLVRDMRQNFNTLGDALSEPEQIVYGSLSDPDLLRRAIAEYEVDTVLHLAAQPIVGVALKDPVGTFEANIRGTWNLLDACRQTGGVDRIVVASSDKAYGHPDVLPYTEDMPLKGSHPYDVSKSCTDLICRTYFETYGLPVCITRAGNFYGGGDLNFSRIVPGTVRLALQGKAPEIRSDGTMIRDYIYVRDVADGYLAIASQMHRADVAGEAFNLSSERPMNVLDLTREILAATGRDDLEPNILNIAKSEIQEQTVSGAKAERILGWRPNHTLAEALSETVDWYRGYLGA